MKTARPMFAQMSARQKRDSIVDAGKALREGRLVVIPTETVYGVAASAASRAALDAMHALAKAAESETGEVVHAGFRHTLHAPSAERLEEILEIELPIHRRLFRRLAPGPVRFVVERPEPEIARIVAAVGALPGVVDDADSVSVRVPNHPIAQAVLAAADVPVVLRRLSIFGWGSGKDIGMLAHDGVADAAGIAAVIDEGPTARGRPSTTVRLTASGGYSVEPGGGVLSEQDIKRHVERSILFVCTGNTCRSPMAEAIAASILAESPALAVTTRVASAGISAVVGQPAAAEAIGTLAELNIRAAAGVPALKSHAARILTRSMVEQADLVLAMTRSHRQAIVSAYPFAADRVIVLDPAGMDLQDPIGGSIELYRHTARKLTEFIRKRLDEMDR